MATVNKDFRIKSGLIVEGTTATLNGVDILAKNVDSDNYIIDLIGGETLVTSVESTQMEVIAGELNIKAGVFDPDGAADAAELAANGYTDTALEDYTTTATLDTTVGGYGYLKNADLPTMYSDSDVDAHLSGGDGITYSTGTISADVAGGLGITAGQVVVDRITVDTWYDAAGDADAAELAANGYTDGEITTALSTAQGYADTAESDAKAYTDLLLGDVTINGTGGNTVTDRIATAVADLVDSAPAALDTLNELAAALGDNVDAEGLATAIGNKLPLAGGTLSGNLAMGTNKITGLGTPTANTDAATKAYVDDQTTTDVAEGTNLYYTDGRARLAIAAGTGIDYNSTTGYIDANLGTGLGLDGSSQIEINRTTVDTWYDAAGTAAGLAGNYDAAGTAQGIVDALDTDDIEEGSTNLYYTDSRATDAMRTYLTDPMLTTTSNLSITYSAGQLHIDAENGVADSDTDDLTEGTTNLYFTDVRAVDALEAVVPNFTAVEINSIAKEVAATATISTAGTTTALTWDTATYRTVKALVKFATATHTEVSEVLLTLDSLDNVAITEYAEVGTSTSMGTVTATVVAGEGRINVTTLNNATVVIVRATLLI